MTYNLDEKKGENHFNCPVVAYYPEVIKANVKGLKNTVFIDDFVGLHHPKAFPSRFLGILQRYFDKPFTLKQVKAAAKQKLIMQAQGYIMSKQKENSQSVLDIMA